MGPNEPQYSQADVAAMMQGQGQVMPDPANDPNALYADTMREDKITNILSQINPDNLMIDIENRVKGLKKNPQTAQWEAINPNQKSINKALLSNFMSFLGSILNQNTSMSNFSANEINSIMGLVITFIRDDLTVNQEKYEITGDYQEMSRIGNIISMSVFSVLKRAQNGMEARRIFGSLRISENLTQAPQAKKGLADALQFWK